MLGFKYEALGADFHYGRRLQRADQGKQGQLRRDGFAICSPLILPIQELQTPLKIHGL